MVSQIPSEEEKEVIEEGEIDFSSMTSKEKDDLILEMHAEEMMQKRAEQAEEEETPVRVMKRRKRKREKPQNAAPGAAPVWIKMGAAMAFSMAFIFLGPIILVMALLGQAGVSLFGAGGDRMWVNALLGILGIGLMAIAWYLFKYLIKD